MADARLRRCGPMPRSNRLVLRDVAAHVGGAHRGKHLSAAKTTRFSGRDVSSPSDADGESPDATSVLASSNNDAHPHTEAMTSRRRGGDRGHQAVRREPAA